MASTPTSDALYRYKPLTPTTQEIRLLTLLPGEWASPIECNVKHVDLDDGPEYEALSYTWGDLNDKVDIRVEGATFSVTRNLEVALRYLRHETQERVLWIDAVCINQVDSAEKSTQIQAMYRIFSSADRVLAWTGKESNDSNTAMDLIEELGSALTFYPWDESPDFLFENFGFDAVSKNWDSLWGFFHRPYWHRVWVIQELHAQGYCTDSAFTDEMGRCRKHYEIGCGKRWIHSNTFQRVCAWLLDLSVSPMAAYKVPGLHIFALKRAPAITMFLCTQNPGNTDTRGRDLPTFLNQTWKFQASDVRDKVFSLLGICEPKYQRLVPDYTQTAEELFRRLVIFLIKTDGCLDILLGNRSHPDWKASWSSWTPSLNLYVSIPSTVWSSKGCTGGGRSRPMIGWNSTQPAILRVKGIRVGKLRRVIRVGDVLANHEMYTFYESLNGTQWENAWKTAIMFPRRRDPHLLTEEACEKTARLLWKTKDTGAVIHPFYDPDVEVDEWHHANAVGA